MGFVSLPYHLRTQASPNATDYGEPLSETIGDQRTCNPALDGAPVLFGSHGVPWNG